MPCFFFEDCDYKKTDWCYENKAQDYCDVFMKSLKPRDGIKAKTLRMEYILPLKIQLSQPNSSLKILVRNMLGL